MTKQYVKNKLREYQWTVKNIDRLKCDLIDIESKLQSVVNAPSDGISGSKNPDKWTNLIDEKIQTENLINEELEKQYRQYRAVQDLISCLDGRESYLMALRYIHGYTWERICVVMGYEWSQIHRIHSHALDLIGKKMMA